jgi:peptidoglycan/LPS O-acetylase OafA/YrhL
VTAPLSFYLDALRFGAALTVFLSHYGAGRISGGLLWQLAGYGRTAVLVFFVLSGFVIAAVTETREPNLEDYALSRAARLYSVILPAFLLTAALDGLGKAIDPTLYGPAWGHSMAHPALGYALSAVFLGESWILTLLPGQNVPFWSLNYEAWYYALFAAAFFLRGRVRPVAFGAAALIAGPKILLLFPIWLMGVAAWRWRAAVPAQRGRLLIAGGLGGFAALEALGGQQLFWHSDTQWLPPGYSAYDYVVGATVAVVIAGLAKIRLPMPSERVERAVHGLAGTSFGLYLLHYPLLNFFGTLIPGTPESGVHRALVFGLALGGGIGLGRVIEPHKHRLRRALRSGLHAVLGSRPQPGLADGPAISSASRSTELP